MKKIKIAFLTFCAFALIWIVLILNNSLQVYRFLSLSNTEFGFDFYFYYYQMILSILLVIMFVTIILFTKSTYKFKLVLSLILLTIIVLMFVSPPKGYEISKYVRDIPTFFSFQVFLDLVRYQSYWDALDHPIFINSSIIEKLQYVSRRSATITAGKTFLYPSIYLELSFLFYLLCSIRYYLKLESNKSNPPFTKKQLEYINNNYQPKDS